MNVTIDLKTLLIILVLIALVVLIIYAIFMVRKLLVTLEHTNKILSDFETVSEIAASRSEDLDGIIENVSGAVSDATSDTGLVTTVTSIAKSAASLRGLFSSGDEETRAAKKTEKRKNRRKN